MVSNLPIMCFRNESQVTVKKSLSRLLASQFIRILAAFFAIYASHIVLTILFGFFSIWNGSGKIFLDILSFPLLTLWNYLRADFLGTRLGNIIFYGLFFGNSFLWTLGIVFILKVFKKYFPPRK